ncbi:MAG: leucyl/phenylalanyl-tRNA--protein transferase [Pseudomonadota bacterium]
MNSGVDLDQEIGPELALRAYALGVFPMATSADADNLNWYFPDQRGIIPLDKFHLPRRLEKTVRQRRFKVRYDTAFEEVVDLCAEKTPTRHDTWINDKIKALFAELHWLGHAHSVESWLNGTLVGGIYGLQIGGVFFGESMFSRARDASKVALVHLVAQLRWGGFAVFDTQFTNKHLTQFGVTTIPGEAFQDLLVTARDMDAVLRPDEDEEAVNAFLEEARKRRSEAPRRP